MQVERQGESREAGEEPGCEESHLTAASLKVVRRPQGNHAGEDWRIQRTPLHEELSAIRCRPVGAVRTPIINVIDESLEQRRYSCEHLAHDLVRHALQFLRAPRGEIESLRLVASNHARGFDSGSCKRYSEPGRPREISAAGDRENHGSFVTRQYDFPKGFPTTEKERDD